MNGRVYAVNRSPVLAWNVEPQLQVPYPDMPAAAAAISPSEPYGRCWQNHADAGANFPYFGTLYSNSLPPPAYRLQASCMSGIGQFWPPTPPPDGCGRFDGSNLYFAPPVTPVLRHGDNIPQNLRSSFQGIGHYSHLVETSKDSSANQRVFKQETSISPSVSGPVIPICSTATKSNTSLGTYCVDSKPKSQDIGLGPPKQKNHYAVQTPGHDQCMCVPDIRVSSSSHPSNEKACCSPSYSMKNTLFHNSSSQDAIAHKPKPHSLSFESSCNASPLKNVYFSHFESENVKPLPSNSFGVNTSDGQHSFEPKSNVIEPVESKHSHRSHPGSLYIHNSFSPSSNLGYRTTDIYNAPSICSTRKSGDRLPLTSDQCRKSSNFQRVKPEKVGIQTDCKYQKPSTKRCPSVIDVPAYKSSKDLFNIPTSVVHPKIEPKEKYFLPSTAQSCMSTNSSPLVVDKDYMAVPRTSANYYNFIFPNSCSLNKPWQYNGLPIMNHPDSYFKTPEAAKPPMRSVIALNPALQENLISVAQTAPQEMDILKSSGRYLNHIEPRGPSHQKAAETAYSEDTDDEVQIIAVQSKSPPSKHHGRNLEAKNNVDEPLSLCKPLCLKNEKKLTDCFAVSEAEKYPHHTPTVTDTSSKCKQSHKDEATPTDISSAMPTNLSTSVKNTCSEPQLQTQQKCEDRLSAADMPDIKPSIDIASSTLESLPVKVEAESAVTVEAESDVKDSKVSEESSMAITKIESATLCEFNENHGLNLLLDTIEKVTSFEKVENRIETVIKQEKIEIASELNYSSYEPSKSSGLDVLSEVAGQCLVKEFKDRKSDSEDSSHVPSNYPEVKQEIKTPGENESGTLSDNSSIFNSCPASVFEMRDRLIELQMKYKQKQKELSRLKPKKMLANSYLKEKKSKDGNDEAENESDTSACSISKESNPTPCLSEKPSVKLENLDDAADPPVLDDNIGSSKEHKGHKRKLAEASVKTESSDSEISKPRTRRSTKSFPSSNHDMKRLKSTHKCSEAEVVHKTRKKEKNLVLTPRSLASSLKESNGPSDIEVKNSKSYALRNVIQSSKKSKSESNVMSSSNFINSKTIASKRKSDNPKKYMPSKQIKLSETIISKHLRNRILFDVSGSVSDDDNQKDGGVPEELYDAMMKCHLGEENKVYSKDISPEKNASQLPYTSLGFPEASRLRPENLKEKHRLLALEEGLFYAGYIKEVQGPDRFGIVLDGQRGNRLHMFTREELLTQTITESKIATSELPEGTRVCAYWSQQYRCLYPGIVGTAPCPSADWSEPRVFVLFDDGDSGQIPIKNIRLIPADIIPSEEDKDQQSENSSKELTKGLNSKGINHKDRKSQKHNILKSRLKATDQEALNENECKESSCTSINDSSCDDSCFASPSQSFEIPNGVESTSYHLSTCQTVTQSVSLKSQKRTRKRSKRKTSCRMKLELTETEKSEKTKTHKKYKDKHRHHHHHHHHRHRHHHHHHHHSKKHKHRRRNGCNSKNLISQDLDVRIHSGTISKHSKSASDVINPLDHIGHSSSDNIPQHK